MPKPYCITKINSKEYFHYLNTKAKFKPKYIKVINIIKDKTDVIITFAKR